MVYELQYCVYFHVKQRKEVRPASHDARSAESLCYNNFFLILLTIEMSFRGTLIAKVYFT